MVHTVNLEDATFHIDVNNWYVTKQVAIFNILSSRKGHVILYILPTLEVLIEVGYNSILNIDGGQLSRILCAFEKKNREGNSVGVSFILSESVY